MQERLKTVKGNKKIQVEQVVDSRKTAKHNCTATNTTTPVSLKR